MRLPSGVTDQFAYFKAVDASDLKSPESGLTGKFRVKRSRNGGAWTTYTTPTINATDTGGDGYYELLLDEDMTIDAGDHSQLMLIHVEDTGGHMYPASLQIELYRPDVTAGQTLSVSGGVGSANAAQIVGDTGDALTLARFTRILNRTTGQLDTGSGMLLSDTGVPSRTADALLDRVDAIEAGMTPRQAIRLLSAMLGGEVSGAGTGTEVFRNAVADSKARVTVTVDGNGNRSSVATDLS